MEDGDLRRKMTQYLLGLVVYTFTECAGCIPSCHFCLLKTRSILSDIVISRYYNYHSVSPTSPQLRIPSPQHLSNI